MTLICFIYACFAVFVNICRIVLVEEPSLRLSSILDGLIMVMTAYILYGLL